VIKSLWILISTLAIVNLVAVVGLVGWLKSSDRLDADRFDQIRALFSETLTEQQSRELEAARLEEAQEAQADAQRRAALPPITGAQQLDLQNDDEELAHMRVLRLRREIDDLRRTLARERATLDEDRATFEADRDAFEAMREQVTSQEADTQFKKAVTLYESLPAAKSQAMLSDLIQNGDTDQAVAYLNAMQTRTAKKIIEKFEDASVAADLLERLRTRGIEARVPEEP
jgi:hypothetical protein